jgi:predicted transcriptional regulator
MIDKQASASDNTMTAPQFAMIPLQANNIASLTPHIQYHLAFRVLKATRMRHKLTINQCIMLNGLYIYTLIGKTEFTVNNAVRFVGYWNTERTGNLFKGLIERGYIVLHSQSGNRPYYRLTDKAFKVVLELYVDFNTVCQRWYSKFNLSI